MKQPNINEYIAQQPAGMQERLQALCDTVRQAAPDAKQDVLKSEAAFCKNGRQVCVSAGKTGIRLRTSADTLAAFAPQLSHYACETGAIEFPNGEALPLDLIEKLVSYDIAHE